jgi:hypothetical protein
MVILRRTDHLHFIDNVEQEHETVRSGLTLCRMGAILRQQEEAQRFFVGDFEDKLAVRGVDVIVHKP